MKREHGDVNSDRAPQKPSGEVKGVSWRGLLLALGLIPFNAYWIAQTEFLQFYGFTSPTCISLFFNVIFILTILALLNAGLRHAVPRFALSRGDLLLVYYMLCIASFLAGEEIMQNLISMVGHAFWYATPENEWHTFHRYLPEWLTIRDKADLKFFYESQPTLSPSEYLHALQAWLPTMAAWVGFLTVMVCVMYCLNVLLRKQWMEHERLSYPIAQLPLELIRDGGSLGFLTKRSVLAGFGVAGVINVLNGFAFLYPALPTIPIKAHDIGPFFATEPWNAMGWTPLSFYPFVIGLGFLIPVELSFSCWFFYVFYKLLLILGKATGFAQSEAAFYPNEQMLGAYVGVLLIALWHGRRYLRQILSHVVRPSGEMDSGEPISYRAALLGVALGTALLVLCSIKAGMTPGIALLFFVIYFAISVSITRLRAELGAPVHDLWSVGSTGPDTFIARTLGTRNLTGETLGVLTLYFAFNEDYRGHIMPHQLESLKLARVLRVGWERLGWATLIATVFGGVCAFWALFHSCYRYDVAGQTWGAFERFQNWFMYPSSPDLKSLGFFGFGAAFMVVLMFIRSRLLWFPFHSLGYALAPGWTMNLIWFPLFISWAIKRFVLRYGGLKVWRQYTPFFLGLILGDFVVGAAWTLVGMVLGTQTYAFWIF